MELSRGNRASEALPERCMRPSRGNLRNRR